MYVYMSSTIHSVKLFRGLNEALKSRGSLSSPIDVCTLE